MYSFKTSLSGTLTCADSRYAEHTENIVIASVTANQQLFPSVKKLEFKVFGVINGKKYALAESQTLECDYIEIVEKYHRSFSELINGLIDAGFKINEIKESLPTKESYRATFKNHSFTYHVWKIVHS